MSGQSTEAGNAIDCLHLSETQHRKLVEKLDAQAQAPKGSDHRQHPRYPYLVPCGVSVRVKHPGSDEWQRYLVRPRNISAGGLGFFHGAYLYQNTYCVVALRTRRGETVQKNGHVAYCRHIAGPIHEIGLAFEDLLDVRTFVQNDDEDDALEESPKQQYAGQVLCIDGRQEDRALLRFHMSELGPEVTDCDDAPEALELAQNSTFHAILLGESLATMSPSELAEALREDGYEGALIQWTASATPADWSDARLPKPFSADDIQTFADNYLPTASDEQQAEREPLKSDLWSRSKMRPLLLNYLETLEEQTVKLQQFVEQQSVDDVVALVRQIKGSAGSYGYPSISEAADPVLDDSQQDTDQMLAAAREVIDLCERACAFRAQVNYTGATANG